MDDRDRVMGVTIRYEAMLAVLQGKLRLPDLADLPDDAQIVAVEHSVLHRGFTLLIQSKSFEPVPVGDRVPMLPPLRVQVL